MTGGSFGYLTGDPKSGVAYIDVLTAEGVNRIAEIRRVEPCECPVTAVPTTASEPHVIPRSSSR